MWEFVKWEEQGAWRACLTFKNGEEKRRVTVRRPSWKYDELWGEISVRAEEPGGHLNKKAAFFTPDGARLGTYNYGIGGVRPRQVAVYETSADERRDGWTTYEAAPYGRESSWDWDTDVIPWDQVDLNDPKYYCKDPNTREKVELLRDIPYRTKEELAAAKSAFLDAAIRELVEVQLEKLNKG